MVDGAPALIAGNLSMPFTSLSVGVEMTDEVEQTAVADPATLPIPRRSGILP